MLEGLVRLSARDTRNRSLRIALVSEQEITSADAVLVDCRDPAALAWAQQQAWLSQKAVIWLDAPHLPPVGHTGAQRPVQWPVFPVLLSRAMEARPRPRPVQPAHPANGAPERRPSLLLVDDSAIARTQIRSLVALRGCDTKEAASVEDGLALVTREHFDMVFMDVLMPGTDGYEGCRKMKSVSRGRSEIPVVMLTSKSSPFDRIRGKIAGCDAYLTKPVDGAQLDAVLAQFAPGSRSLHSLTVRQSRFSAPPVGGNPAII